MTGRRLRTLAAAVPLCMLTACATTRPARRFAPPSREESMEALAAWRAILERAASLPAARLLYDARVSKGGAPPVPGTLAVTYDGRAVVSASLTGPFGSRIAEYRDGRVTGEDRSALLVEPDAMRAVLAGAWNGAAPSVEGMDAGDALLVFEAERSSVRVVLDVARRAPRSLEIEGGGGHLVVDYGGETDPWPSRVDASEETTHRRVTLKLLALEKADGEAAAR